MTGYKKEDSRWMVEALTRLVNFSTEKLRVIELTQFADAVSEFLGDDFFQYKSIDFYGYSGSRSKWELLARRGGDPGASVPDFSLHDRDKIWREGKYLYNFSRMDDDCTLLILSQDDGADSFSEYETSFLTMLSTLSNTMYHMKKMGVEMEKKVIEISNIRASIDVINGLKEGKISLEEAVLELYQSLSLEKIILAVPDKAGNFTIAVNRGSSISDWDDFIAQMQGPENEEESLELFTLVDSRHYNYGVLSCCLSRRNPALYAIQLRTLENLIPQITLVLSEQRMSQAAVTDPLTGLFNRRHVAEVLKNRESLIKTDPLFKMAVMMMDVDHFKTVNDTYGHDAGDQVLKTVAGVIQHVVRDVDVVGRYGGEEFVVLMHCGFDIAIKVAERIRKNIEVFETETEGRNISVTISIGLAQFTADATHEQVVRRADQNLYKAKNSGRNKVIY